MKEKNKNLPHAYVKSLWEHARTNKVAYIIFLVLNILTILTTLFCIFTKNFNGAFVGFLALLLLLIPPFVKKSFKVELPTVLESIAYFFVFCAQILGELGSWYTKFIFWDAMLHTVCGFIFAAFGFCLFDILNKNRKSKFELSPFFLTLLAFCFSITVGTIWEFFEFGMDIIMQGDMQKDTVIKEFGSCFFNSDNSTAVIKISDIKKTVIYTKDGQSHIVDGYLDIGLFDTVKDMFVNFIGALVFSIFGYLYIKNRGQGKVASQFIPVLKADETEEAKADVNETEPNQTEIEQTEPENESELV